MANLIGAVSFLLSFSNNADLLRIVFGHLFVFIFSGWNLSKVFLPKTSFLERLVTSSLFSILLTYPATVIVTILEGQSGEAIFSRHLLLSISILFTLSLLAPFIASKLLPKPPKLRSKKTSSKLSIVLFASLLIYSSLTFTNLGRADLNGDEYDLAYQSYNLVDGIRAGRKAYVISYSGHPPLSSSLKHFSLNLLEPSGLDHLSDWHFRFSEGILGILVIITTYLLATHIFTPTVANYSVLILSSSNYLVWLGRIYHREMLLTLTMALAVYYLTKSFKQPWFANIAGIALGASLLTKETALLVAPLIFSYLGLRKSLNLLSISLAIFLPVILYNLAALAFTGYADVFFSTLFGIYRPGATPRDELNVISNTTSIVSYLNDIISPAVLAVFTLSLLIFTFQTLKHSGIQFQRANKKQLLIVWIGSIITFFIVSAIRGYYFLPIIIPFSLITAFITLSTIRSKHIRTAFLFALLLYQTAYTTNSNINRQDTASNHPGNVDGAITITKSPLESFSKVVVGWTFNSGYRQLLSDLNQNTTPQNCIIFDTTLNPLLVRRYFWTQDQIKKHYLNSYSHRFPDCHSDNPTHQPLLVSQQSKHNLTPAFTSNDADSNPRFYIYSLQEPDQVAPN